MVCVQLVVPVIVFLYSPWTLCLKLLYLTVYFQCYYCYAHYWFQVIDIWYYKTNELYYQCLVVCFFLYIFNFFLSNICWMEIFFDVCYTLAITKLDLALTLGPQTVWHILPILIAETFEVQHRRFHFCMKFPSLSVSERKNGIGCSIYMTKEIEQFHTRHLLNSRPEKLSTDK